MTPRTSDSVRSARLPSLFRRVRGCNHCSRSVVTSCWITVQLNHHANRVTHQKTLNEMVLRL